MHRRVMRELPQKLCGMVADHLNRIRKIHGQFNAMILIAVPPRPLLLPRVVRIAVGRTCLTQL
jgi:hypothetical protein